MYKIKNKISYFIILAQIASDGGKGITDILVDADRKCLPNISKHINNVGYDSKDECIQKAIALILSTKRSDFFFNVITSKIGYSPCFIVYFNYKINNVKKQISFHSFDDDLSKFVSSTHKTRWLKNETCRNNVLELLERNGVVDKRFK